MSNPEITQTKGSGCSTCETCLRCIECPGSILVGMAGYGTVVLLN